MPTITATADDLPPAVASALADPLPGERGVIETDGVSWPILTWGDPSDPLVLLVHGVTSNAETWWRIGPGVAAAGRRVVAVDMPGHGQTRPTTRSHRLIDTASELAAAIRSGGLDRSDLAVVGHSWGGMVSAHLPAAGVSPAIIVLFDPPVLTLDRLKAIAEEATEQPYPTMAEALTVVRSEYPAWSDRDVEAKAQALTEFDFDLVRDILLENGAWDGGLAALRDPKAGRTNVWFIRGEWATGGLVPESEVPALEQQLGPDRVLTIAGGPHSPHRTHPEATLLAILRALGGPPDP